MKNPISGRHDEKLTTVRVPGDGPETTVVSYRTENGWACIATSDETYQPLRAAYGTGTTRSAAVANWKSEARKLMDG
jgi:hypothetical protein